ncbi:kremen protein 1 isoform X4 [Anas platyrhynchos]|uniref:kremen protein 1 isoform X4 n=1 Tax=Anas platyrhynchos TaxID=8839 RepID=UPI0018D77662|nr:kremen protein 1 isoform X4 [Anas platyrhynchos]
MHLRESPRPCPCRVSGPRKELRSACSPSSPRLLCTGRTNTVSPSRPLRWAGRAVLQHQSDSPASHRAELLPHRPPRRSRSTGPCRAPSRSHRAPAEPPCETGVLSPPRALHRREEGRGICMLPSAGRQSAGDPRLAEAERGAGTVAGRSQSPRLGGADGLCRVSSVATVGGLSARGQSGMPREIHGSLGGAGAGAGAGPAAASLVDGRLCPRGELRGAPVLASGASTSSPNPSVSDVKAAVPRSSDAAGPAECYTANGADYRGTQNQTSQYAGKPCLFWNETFEHPYNTLKYPNGEGGLGEHNYCRNPDGDVSPWCYIAEHEDGIYWKYCEIPSCRMPGNLGCYKDHGEPPPLTGTSETSNKLTIQTCISSCRSQQFKFAGMESGYACFCGNNPDYWRYGEAASTECNSVCFGDHTQPCGGDGRVILFDNEINQAQGFAIRYKEWTIYSLTALLILSVTAILAKIFLHITMKSHQIPSANEMEDSNEVTAAGEIWSIFYQPSTSISIFKKKLRTQQDDCNPLVGN